MAAMKNLKEIFAGKSLVKANGDKVKAEEVLATPSVGIYFSAHWCPPCRGFTPVLKEAYNSDDLKGKMEIIFVSSDRSEEDALSYMKESHGDWVMVDYEDDDLRDVLKKGCSVNGIPALHFFKDGVHITKKGRELISNKKYADIVSLDPALFAPKKLPELLKGHEFSRPNSGSDDKVSADEILKKSLIGVYFSAHWCPPCKTFTPKLKKAYEDKHLGDDCEIIFISADDSEEAAVKYMKESHGNWVKGLNEDKELMSGLVETCEVSGIPALHFFKNGEHKTAEGRGLVEGEKWDEILKL